jgi:hypothetical protein
MKKLLDMADHELGGLLNSHDDAEYAAREANENLAKQKHKLCAYAIENHLLDCLTVNINKLKRYR